MTKPHFASVKSHYKLTSKSFINSGGCNYANTCAVRLSSTLIAANPAFKKVFSKAPGNICGPHGNMRGAQDLASILRTSFRGIDQSPKSAKDINGKKGIVCFMNISNYGGQGHITLWDKTHSVDGGEYWDSSSPIWFWKLP